MSDTTITNPRRLARAKIRHATFIDPQTGVRSKRSFTLHHSNDYLPSMNANGIGSSPLSNNGILSAALRDDQAEEHPSKWSQLKTATTSKWRTCWAFATSELGIGMFKCALAYLLGSLYTFIPAFNVLLDKVDSKHVAATVTVYFHPARTRGSALKALVVAFVAFLYTATVGVTSMAVSMLFVDTLHQMIVGHIVVLICFVGGGLGFVGWVKLTHSDALINIACSLTNLSLISVLTKEGAVQAGDLSFGKIGQYLKMIVAGVIATTLVALLVLPVSARMLFRKNMLNVTDTMSDMLGIITSSFISGDEAELENKELNGLGATQKKMSTALKTNLSEAKIELNVRGYEEEAKISARMVQCVDKIAQSIGGLRSAASMQFVIVKESRPPLSMLPGQLYELYDSLTTSPARTPNPERIQSIGQEFEHMFGANTPAFSHIEENGPLSPEAKASKFRSGQQIFELFIDHLGPSMRSLAFTMKEILDELPFDADNKYAVANNPRFRTSLENALALYKEARKSALETVYARQHLDRSRPLEVEADWEEAATCCGQFSFCLLEVAEHIKEYLVILDDLEAEIETRPTGRTWSWLKFWKKSSSKKSDDESKSTQPNSIERDLANDYKIGKPKPRMNAYEQDVYSGNVRMNFKQRFYRRIYQAFSSLRRDDKKFFIKVGFGAVLYALPSYIPATRPFYTHWRGEWGLLSYMLVCSMTIGASNTTGWQRIWGTCLGAVLAIIAWYICYAKAVPLAIFGFIMAYWTAYVILEMGKGPLGRFIMLTYNLSALYAYNVLIVGTSGQRNDDEDSSNTPQIVTIALHRSVAVISGCIWGLIITRAVWPMSARRKLKDGLTLLWLRMGLIWRRDPLSVFIHGEHQDKHMNLKEELDLQAFLDKLNSLVALAQNEFVMRRPFPTETYTRILSLCSRMLEAFHQMYIVINKDPNASPGERALLDATVRERDELCSRLSHQFSVLASSMKLEYSIANDALPDTDRTRDRLLAKIFAYRRQDADEQITTDEDYSLLYAYSLVTGQIGMEIKLCLKEIESLFGVLDEEALWLQ